MMMTNNNYRTPFICLLACSSTLLWAERASADSPTLIRALDKAAKTFKPLGKSVTRVSTSMTAFRRCAPPESQKCIKLREDARDVVNDEANNRRDIYYKGARVIAEVRRALGKHGGKRISKKQGEILASVTRQAQKEARHLWKLADSVSGKDRDNWSRIRRRAGALTTKLSRLPGGDAGYSAAALAGMEGALAALGAFYAEFGKTLARLDEFEEVASLFTDLCQALGHGDQCSGSLARQADLAVDHAEGFSNDLAVLYPQVNTVSDDDYEAKDPESEGPGDGPDSADLVVDLH